MDPNPAADGGSHDGTETSIRPAASVPIPQSAAALP